MLMVISWIESSSASSMVAMVPSMVMHLLLTDVVPEPLAIEIVLAVVTWLNKVFVSEAT